MPGIVADTHALLWYLLEPERLSRTANDALEEAIATGGVICISAISLVELVYLVEKGRVPKIVLDQLNQALESRNSEIEVIPLDREVVRFLQQIPRQAIPDMPDRIIAATALHLDMPLVSRDAKIKAAAINTIW